MVTTMKNKQRSETLQHLHAMLAETVQAHDLTADGRAIPAIQALLRARHLGKQSIAALLGDCLKTTTEQTDEMSIPRLMELIGFAQQALCPACRSEVGKRWKEAEDV